MSPVRVKLGDFGISKQIKPQATTTFHTQVSTRIYGAPEVLGLDSNSETSVYTNSVDIWSLGCVIYELLAGTRLFASETQVFRYFFGIWPFPENHLKGLPSPTDDAGISLLKSMLAIQPEDRPTAEGALDSEWLTGLQSDDEDGGDDQDEATRRGDEKTRSEKREGKPTARDEPKKEGSQRNPTTKDDRKHAPRNIASGVSPGPELFNDPTPLESEIDTAITVLPDAASAESALIPKGSMKLELIMDTSESPENSFQGPQSAEEKTDQQYFRKVFLD